MYVARIPLPASPYAVPLLVPSWIVRASKQRLAICAESGLGSQGQSREPWIFRNDSGATDIHR